MVQRETQGFLVDKISIKLLEVLDFEGKTMDTLLKWLNLSMHSSGIRMLDKKTLCINIKKNQPTIEEIEYTFLMNSKQTILKIRKKELAKLD